MVVVFDLWPDHSGKRVVAMFVHVWVQRESFATCRLFSERSTYSRLRHMVQRQSHDSQYNQWAAIGLQVPKLHNCQELGSKLRSQMTGSIHLRGCFGSSCCHKGQTHNQRWCIQSWSDEKRDMDSYFHKYGKCRSMNAHWCETEHTHTHTLSHTSASLIADKQELSAICKE